MYQIEIVNHYSRSNSRALRPWATSWVGDLVGDNYVGDDLGGRRFGWATALVGDN